MKKSKLAVCMLLMASITFSACKSNDQDESLIEQKQEEKSLEVDDCQTESDIKGVSSTEETRSVETTPELTMTDVTGQDIATRLDIIAANVSTDYEGNICGLLDYLSDKPFISTDGVYVTINRKIDGDKIYYEIDASDGSKFNTPEYDNLINVAQEVNLLDLNGDDQDEILVTSYVNGTSGYVVEKSDLFSYAGGEWLVNEIVEEGGCLTDTLVTNLDVDKNVMVSEVYLVDDEIKLEIDKGEKADGVYTPQLEEHILWFSFDNMLMVGSE